jgi:hypothetical protein
LALGMCPCFADSLYKMGFTVLFGSQSCHSFHAALRNVQLLLWFADSRCWRLTVPLLVPF